MAKRSKQQRVSSGKGWSLNADQPVPMQQTVLAAQDHRLSVTAVRGKHGRMTTRIAPLALTDKARKQLAKQLKQLCGGGGSDADDEIVLQGEHVEVVRRWLSEAGWGLK